MLLTKMSESTADSHRLLFVVGEDFEIPSRDGSGVLDPGLFDK
jgi:hypothetical protein